MPVLVADQDLVGLEVLSPPGFEILRYGGRTIPERMLEVADALYVRSTVQLDPVSLPAGLHFVGTATIGTEHLPLDALRTRGIAVANAPGCNALAVTDYVLATIARWAADRNRDLKGLRIGIVGYGQIGQRLAARARTLGCQVMISDPPAAERQQCPEDQPWDQMIAAIDVLSVHVPLTTTGDWPTLGMLSPARLTAMRSGGLVVNAARGRLLATATIMQRPDLDWALDVFPEEPYLSDSLLSVVWQVSPHIAGHSLAGKWRGTQLVADAHRRHLSLPVTQVPTEGASTQDRATWDEILSCCGLVQEDRRLREALRRVDEGPSRCEAFDRTRRAYVLRAESIRDQWLIA